MELVPTALYQSSLNALDAAEYLAVPQLRHIQCAILYVVTLFVSHGINSAVFSSADSSTLVTTMTTSSART